MTVHDALRRLSRGLEEDAFAHLGPHRLNDGSYAIRVLWPEAASVTVKGQGGTLQAERIDDEGLFEVRLGADRFDPSYSLIIDGPCRWEGRDPYSFWPLLGALDRHLVAEGRHYRLDEVLGAQVRDVDGVEGTLFSLWAPNARRVSVVGDFNGWDRRRHPMRFHPGCGLWEIFLPAVGAGSLYKFSLTDGQGRTQVRTDPVGRYFEQPPGNAAIVVGPDRYNWGDEAWMNRRRKEMADRPLSIYEVHLGSWKRHPDGRLYSYRDLAETLVPYVLEMGFTHVELLPPAEHPFYGSWGYLTTGYFAPTSRYGPPEDFQALVDAFHRADIGVIIDWVPAHFPKDDWGLAQFDGTSLYEHDDPRQGEHPHWGTKIFNYGRNEVRNFLIASALCWCRRYHVDGLRVDAVASMLYLDYGREGEGWIPNRYGGRENLEAVDFLSHFHNVLASEFPQVFTIAEESTAWPGVTKPTPAGGLGFTFKWNMGWMHDVLAYFSLDPIYRSYHHEDLTFGLLYAFSEKFLLPLSHDEVVHLKGSLWERMAGDRWRKAAQLRLLYAFMTAYPGKKLLFMGGEFGQEGEWDHDRELSWQSLTDPLHEGIRLCSRDLMALYRLEAPLWEQDDSWRGFSWIDCQDRFQSVLSWVRTDRSGRHLLFVANFTPEPRRGYRLGLPQGGLWRERLNTDASLYGGSGIGNLGAIEAEPLPWHGRGWSAPVTLPPLSALLFTPADPE